MTLEDVDNPNENEVRFHKAIQNGQTGYGNCIDGNDCFGSTYDWE